MLALALFIVGAILAVVALIQSRGTAILAWAVLTIACGLLLPRLL